MDVFMQGLNVTIYGLGIVFLALLVLMVTIMVLSKTFEVTTGNVLFAAAPTPGPRPAASTSSEAGEETPVSEAAEEGVASGEVLGQVTAPLPGKILSMAVKAGDIVHKGDEVCVIEAMKMGNSIKADLDGVIGEVLVAAGDSVTFGAPIATITSGAQARAASRKPTAPAPAATSPTSVPPAVVAPVAFELMAEGKQHKVELKPVGNSISVSIDGQTFQVQREQADPRKFVVAGKSYSVEVKDAVGGVVTVLVDGIARKVDLGGAAAAATAADVATAFAPGSFKLALGVSQHDVEIKDATESAATVVVDGVAHRVERGKGNGKVVVVNGKPFVVDVRDRTGRRADVLIDGQPRTVQLLDVKTAPASAPKPAVQPAPAPATPSSATVAAASPAPTATAAPSTSATGEKVTAPLPGKIISVAVKPGDVVRRGDELCVIEAMKMGNSIKAQRDGVVQEVFVSPGDSVAFGSPLLVMG